MLKVNAGLAQGGPSKLVIEVVGRSATPTGAFLEFVSKDGSAEVTPKHVGAGSVIYEVPIDNGSFVFDSRGRGQVRWPVRSPTYLGFSVWQRLVGQGAFEVIFSNEGGKVFQSALFKEDDVKSADPGAEESERNLGGGVKQWIVDFSAELT